MKKKIKKTEDKDTHKRNNNVIGEIKYSGKDNSTECFTVTEENLFGLENVMILDNEKNGKTSCFGINPGEVCVVEDSVSDPICQYVIMCGGVVLKFNRKTNEVFSDLPWNVLKNYITDTIEPDKINPSFFVISSRSFKNLVPEGNRYLIPEENDSLVMFYSGRKGSILKYKPCQKCA
jgi:hypothetical protein